MLIVSVRQTKNAESFLGIKTEKRFPFVSVSIGKLVVRAFPRKNENKIKMNVVQSIKPVTRVFQSFGLSVASSVKFKKHSFEHFLKIYSILHITLRVAVFSYTLATDQFFIRSIKLPMFKTIDTVLVCAVRVIEIVNMVEALIKFREEQKFMDNLLEIDDILMHHFDVDIKPKQLRRASMKRLFTWTCIIIIFLLGIIYLSIGNDQYLCLWLTFIPPFLTSSLTYFQIITWVELIKYRLNKINQLVRNLNNDRHLITTDIFGSIHGSLDTVHDSRILDRCVIFCDLYRRMWMQANLVNDRFKCSMVFNIGNDFVSLVSNLYWIFMCILKKSGSDEISSGSSFLLSFISIFHIWMLSGACHSTAEEATRTAHAIHCIRQATYNTQLNLFVSIENECAPYDSFDHLSWGHFCRFNNSLFKCYTKKYDSTHLDSSMLIIRLSLW